MLQCLQREPLDRSVVIVSKTVVVSREQVSGESCVAHTHHELAVDAAVMVTLFSVNPICLKWTFLSPFKQCYLCAI